jgi:hypothetical protein
MNKNILYTISGFIIVIAVLIAGFFLLGIERITLHYYALDFLLFSLIISLISTITIVSAKKNNSSVFYNAGLSGAVWLYQIAVIITMFFVNDFRYEISQFIFIEIIINALYFIAVILIVAFSSHAHKSNVKTAEKLENGDYNTPKRGGF